MITDADLIEDVEWIIDGSNDPAVTARKLGYESTSALARRLRRAGRYDLARRIDRKFVVA